MKQIKIDQPIVGYSVKKDKEPDKPVVPTKKLKRPEALSGVTLKIKKGGRDPYNLYMTINSREGTPFEVFFGGSHMESYQWMMATSRLISSGLRSIDPALNLEFYARELMLIHSDDGYFAGGKGGFVPSIAHHIGKTLLRYCRGEFTAAVAVDEPNVEVQLPTEAFEELDKPVDPPRGTQCTECKEFAVVTEGGCSKCTSCGAAGECG